MNRTRLSHAAVNTIVGAAMFSAAVSLYQWVALLEMRTTGEAPACAVSETLNCEAIWNSPLSSSIHDLTGIPFPGWGLAWSGVIIVLAFPLLLGGESRHHPHRILGLRLVSGVGGLIVLGLLGYSLYLGIVCPTCLLFYCGVGAALFVSLRYLSPATSDWPMAAVHSGGALAILVLLLLYPGQQTPRQTSSIDALKQAAPTTTQAPNAGDPLEQLIDQLSPDVRAAVAETLTLYRQAPLLTQEMDPSRTAFGDPSAPVRIVEWIDIRCPHCRNLHMALNEIERISPSGSWSLESRNYPLDHECNAGVSRSDGAGVNCLAAKMLICLSGEAREPQVRDALFENQRNLTQQMIWEIAAPDAPTRETLETCVGSDNTASKLAQDIEYAQQRNIGGTPLVAINGRTAPALPALIYALILAGGNDRHPAFDALTITSPRE